MKERKVVGWSATELECVAELEERNVGHARHQMRRGRMKCGLVIVACIVRGTCIKIKIMVCSKPISP